jgi:hypothetical protein
MAGALMRRAEEHEVADALQNVFECRFETGLYQGLGKSSVSKKFNGGDGLNRQVHLFDHYTPKAVTNEDDRSTTLRVGELIQSNVV